MDLQELPPVYVQYMYPLYQYGQVSRKGAVRSFDFGELIFLYSWERGSRTGEGFL
jgi:hypothetical protein